MYSELTLRNHKWRHLKRTLIPHSFSALIAELVPTTLILHIGLDGVRIDYTAKLPNKILTYQSFSRIAYDGLHFPMAIGTSWRHQWRHQWRHHSFISSFYLVSKLLVWSLVYLGWRIGKLSHFECELWDEVQCYSFSKTYLYYHDISSPQMSMMIK